MRQGRETSAPGPVGERATDGPFYELRLYVAGSTPRSLLAIEHLRQLCEGHFVAGQYDVEVIDVYQQPQRARDDQIVAAPTLVKSMPAPGRRVVGDLSDRERVVAALHLHKC